VDGRGTRQGSVASGPPGSILLAGAARRRRRGEVSARLSRERHLLASVANGIRTCAPAKLVDGFYWPREAARAYAIAGHPAIALYATAGSGDSVLWMYTTWQDPPILANPSQTIERGGGSYDLYTAGGRLHQIAWRVGASRVWLTNTLRDTLTNAQMLALAESCR
jgi:hypothetical protein